MKIFVLCSWMFLISFHSFAEEPKFPSAKERVELITSIAAEMKRLDAEGFWVRQNRRASFDNSILESLKREAYLARSWKEFTRVLQRLDLSYPNLHSKLEPGKGLLFTREKVKAAATFTVDWIDPGKTEFRIRSVQESFFPARGDAPQVGDRLLKINGVSMEEWSNHHFEFCKWPLQAQCDLVLASTWFGELLSWTRKEELQYTLERNGRIWNATIPIAGIEKSEKTKVRPCSSEGEMYSGFRLVHRGHFACVHENIEDPTKAILRISSFLYEGSENNPFPRLIDEVEALVPWWLANAGKIDHLVIDLADNGGGNAPIPYYEILLDRPFQEQWFQVRKVPELLNPSLRANYFWDEPAQEIWFQNLQRKGIWDHTLEGDFLPPVPMFCVDPKKDCSEGKFNVRNHSFRGKVSLVVNPFCVSSCDGFAYNVKDVLQNRVKVVGQSQAADSTYSRLRIAVFGEPGDYSIRILSRNDPELETALFTQTIAVSRSVTAGGEVMSGRPLPLDRFVPLSHSESPQEWRQKAVRTAFE